MNKALTTRTDLPAAVVSLIAIPPRTITFVDIRRDTTTYPRIDAVPTEVAIEALSQIIFRAAFNAAPSTFKDEDQKERIAVMAAELYDVCLEDYEGLGTHLLSFAEIARVLRAASVTRNLYGVSTRSMYDALLDYCEGEGRKASQIIKAEKWNNAPTHRPALPTNTEVTALAEKIATLTKTHKAI